MKIDRGLVIVAATLGVTALFAPCARAAAAAVGGPSQPSSYGPQPTAANEGGGGGHWAWVRTTNEAIGDAANYVDPSGTNYYNGSKDGSFASAGQAYSPFSTATGTIQGVGAYVSGGGYANPPFLVIFNATYTFGGSQAGSYRVVYTREWVGSGTPTMEVATASAGGNAVETDSCEAAADQGSSASVSTNMSGSCSGLNPSPKGGAQLKNVGTSANAAYSQVNSQLSVSGNIGNPLKVSSDGVNVTGTIDQAQTQNGVGNATGGSSFSVESVPDSLDSDQSGIKVSASGAVGVVGSGSGQSPGSANLYGEAEVLFTESASG
jgi:hypothetical protein